MNTDLDIDLLEPDTPSGDAALQAVVGIEQRRSRLDDPLDPVPREVHTRAWLTQTWGAARRETWMASTGGGVVGAAVLTIFEADNTHAIEIGVVVDPAARRRGIGTALVEHARGRTRAQGRRLVLTETSNDAGAAFSRSCGFHAGLRMPRRRLELAGLDPARRDADLAQAWGHAGGYQLVEASGVLPDELIGGVVRLMEAMNDSPTDDLDVEDQVYNAERWRQREQSRIVRGQRAHFLFARHLESGELVGMTEVIDRDEEGAGFQGDTVVLKEHRGHRLGTVLKLEMSRRLARLAPLVRHLDTWNAASNAHMLAINDAMGYRIVGEAIEWQREA